MPSGPGCAERVAQEFAITRRRRPRGCAGARAVTGQAFGTGVAPATTGAATIEAATTEAAATNDLPGATGATRATRAFRVRGPRSTRTRLLALHPFRAPRRVSRPDLMREPHNSITESDIRPKE